MGPSDYWRPQQVKASCDRTFTGQKAIESIQSEGPPTLGWLVPNARFCEEDEKVSLIWRAVEKIQEMYGRKKQHFTTMLYHMHLLVPCPFLLRKQKHAD